MQTDRGSSLHLPFPLVKPPPPTQPNPTLPPSRMKKTTSAASLLAHPGRLQRGLPFVNLITKESSPRHQQHLFFSKDREMFFIFSAKHLQIEKLQRLQKLPFTNKRHKCPLGYSGSSYLSLLSRIALPPFSCLSCLFCLLVPEMLVKIVNRIAVLSSPQMFTSVVIQEVVWSML